MNNRKKNINEINENGTEKRKKRGNGSLTDTRKIHLGPGTPLAEHCGAEVLRLDVATPAEAVRAIMLEHPGARSIIEAGQWMIRDGDHLAGGDWDLTAQRGRSDIYILPAGEGANDGLGKIFAGIGLAIFGLLTGGTGFIVGVSQATYVGLGAALALSGLSRVLSPTPAADAMELEGAASRQSGLFSHPSTLAAPGEPVPIIYGHPRTGGLRVSNEQRHQYGCQKDGTSTTNLRLHSTEYARVIDVISEGIIEGVDGEAVFIQGDPLSAEPNLNLELLTGTAGQSALGMISRSRQFVADLPQNATVEIFPTDDRTEEIQIALYWPALFTGGAANLSSATVLVKIEVNGSLFTGPSRVRPWLSGGGVLPDYGVICYNRLAADPVTVKSFGPFSAGISSPGGNRLRFRLVVFWDNTGGGTFPYPGVPQEFELYWRNYTGPGTPGPWETPKSFFVEKVRTTGADDVGASSWVELGPDDLSAGMPNGWDIKIDTLGAAFLPSRYVIFQYGAELSPFDYGTAQQWSGSPTGEAEARGIATSGFFLDVTVPVSSTATSIEVTRTTADQPSDSLNKDAVQIVGLQERSFIENTLDFPDSAVAIVSGSAGLYAGAMGAIVYQVKGLKISLPTGYDPVAGTFTSPWDGTFQATKLYSNDPAWILWDLLVSDRFGLSIDPARIDKWSFGVASRRNLTLAPDLVTDGVTERRYTWNGAITASADGFKVASQIAASMDAQIWISTQGLIFLGQDAPQTEISRLITQANVIGGLFTYEGSAVDARRNVASTTYRNARQFHNPTTTREYRQFSIDRYGETAIETDLPGVTSTGQAIRAARRILITDETENQTVRFQIGLENSAMQPGDLIEIADASRSQEQNGSRISSVFATGGTVYVNGGTNDWATIATPGVSRARWLTTSGVVVDANVALIWFGLLVANGTADWALPITEGAPVMISTATPETWRVLEIVDDGDGLYTVLAAQHDADKWTAIDDPTDLGTAYTFPADVWPPPGFPS